MRQNGRRYKCELQSQSAVKRIKKWGLSPDMHDFLFFLYNVGK